MTARGWFVSGLVLGLLFGSIVGVAWTHHDSTCHVETLAGSPHVEVCVRDLR